MIILFYLCEDSSIFEKKFSSYPDFMDNTGYTISKKSVTKQRTELGIRNWEFEEISSPPRTPKSEPRIMMD